MDTKPRAAKRNARPDAPNATVNIPVRVKARPANPRMMNPSRGSANTHTVKFVISLAS
jgi:hypothetical protein